MFRIIGLLVFCWRFVLWLCWIHVLKTAGVLKSRAYREKSGDERIFKTNYKSGLWRPIRWLQLKYAPPITSHDISDPKDETQLETRSILEIFVMQRGLQILTFSYLKINDTQTNEIPITRRPSQIKDSKDTRQNPLRWNSPWYSLETRNDKASLCFQLYHLYHSHVLLQRVVHRR